MATAGEVVICKREPTNPVSRTAHTQHLFADLTRLNQYDSNAIRVDNVLGQQIGHIPRAVAAKLAPYLVSAGSNLVYSSR